MLGPLWVFFNGRVLEAACAARTVGKRGEELQHVILPPLATIHMAVLPGNDMHDRELSSVRGANAGAKHGSRSGFLALVFPF